jgi:hypothetical protein
MSEMCFYVAVDGHDGNPGTMERPFLSLRQAQRAVRALKYGNRWPTPTDGGVTVYVRGGCYSLSQPLVFTPEDSGVPGGPVRYCVYPGERVVLGGVLRVEATWERHRDGIMKCRLSGPEFDGREFDQLFVNGVRQTLARYPNAPLQAGRASSNSQSWSVNEGYLTALGGTNRRPDEELLFDPAGFKRWADPSTGILHAFQSHYWGNMQYRIRDVDWEQGRMRLGEGGFQLQRHFGINERSRYYVENVLEELDAPSEWFWDKAGGILYYYPQEGLDLDRASFELAELKQLVEFRGSSAWPVSHLELSGFTFTCTRRTCLDVYEDLARGDWAIHRGGAVFVQGAEDCTIRDCAFTELGGNAVFIDGYNRRIAVGGCLFEGVGESAVCLVGSSEAVRMYRTWEQDERGESPGVDSEVGPKTPDYPDNCVIDNNIIRRIGVYGKQTAGVFISMSRRIAVSHNTIYEVPRAAICINDGTWGGHRIEGNDIWETVRETGEHGPFNCWGRERQWGDASQQKGTNPQGMNKEAVFWDALEPVVVCSNRIANERQSVSAGNWTIDLDDGSSFYHIYNNLCLGSTLKLRDGYYRKAENNIFVSPVPLGWHVWPEDSGDEFIRNIVVVTGTKPGEKAPTEAMIQPIRMPAHPWGTRHDRNVYWNANTGRFFVQEKSPNRTYDWEEWRGLGYDAESVVANPLFVAPEKGDYRAAPGSPALELGFVNFPMDRFGHRQTRIKPYGGEFVDAIEVRIVPDARGGTVWYTLDGSDPRPGGAGSMRYEVPVKLTDTATIRAATYKGGIAQGFEACGEFRKVAALVRPSWLETLLQLNSAPAADRPIQMAKTVEPVKWRGAFIADIADGDLIDALGGHNEGVLLVEVPAESEAHALGLRTSDVIVEYAAKPTPTLQVFEELTRNNGNEPNSFTVLRGYARITIPVTPAANPKR